MEVMARHWASAIAVPDEQIIAAAPHGDGKERNA
jgi:hypothetical protein